MAQKTCPSCKTKCGPAKRICPGCKHEFIIRDNDSEKNSEYELDLNEYPERKCVICEDIFYPSIVNTSISGNPRFVWHYYNYCSQKCLELGENKLFDYLTTLSNLPEDIKKIVNENSLEERTSDPTHTNHLNFSNKYSSTVPCPEDFIRIIPSLEAIYPEESLERQAANLLDLPLGDYLESVLDDPSISNEIKNKIRPKRGQKKCPSCNSIVASKKYKCDICDYDFRNE